MKLYIVFIWSLFAVVCLGWGFNISALVKGGLESVLTVESVLRIVGVPIVPLGSVMGWFF